MYLVSPTDDAPEPFTGSNQISVGRLSRERNAAVNGMDDCIRMVLGQRAGDNGFFGPGCRKTLAETRNALEGFLLSLKEVEAEVLPPQPLPVSKPFGRRRIPDASLPATVSPARF